MPVRKIKKSYRNVTSALVSRKNQRTVESESTLERDLYHGLEFDPLVASFEEQPVTIPYQMADGRISRYTPDVIINFTEKEPFVWNYSPFRYLINPDAPKEPSPNNPFVKNRQSFFRPKAILAEVKYRRDLIEKWSEHKPKFKAARTYARERGWEFRILTEKEIRSPVLNNIKFIRRYGHYKFAASEMMVVLNKLAEFKSCRMSDLLTALAADRMAQGQLIPLVWYLIFRHEILVDWSLPLTMNSKLRSIL